MNFWLYIPKYKDFPAQLHCYVDICWSKFDRIIDPLLKILEDEIMMIEWEDSDEKVE